jgi:hypothetical protein
MSSRNVASFGSPMAPGAHGARQQRLPGGESELRAQQMDDTGGICRLFHATRLCGIGGERLLAHDVAPGAHRLQYQVQMCVGRRGHAHYVGTGERERVGERDQRVRDPEPGRPLPRPIRVAPHERLHLKAGGLQGPHVRQAPESCSDDHRAQRISLHPHRYPPLSPLSPLEQPADVGRIVAVPALPRRVPRGGARGPQGEGGTQGESRSRAQPPDCCR